MYHNIVLICLTIANILNLFIGRFSEDRQVILAANGIAIITTVIFLINRYVRLPRCYFALKLFTVIFFIYLVVQFLLINNRYFVLNTYIRWLTSILFIFFFYSLDENERSNKLMRIFIITFIAQCAFKIIFGKSFNYIEAVSKKVGGDTASMGIALAVPLLLTFFKNKTGLFLYIACWVFCLFSLRRSSILAIACTLPFVWPSLKRHINKKYLILGGIIGLLVFSRVWEYVGDKLINRFFEYQSDTSEITSYGSGRTEFWSFLYNRFIENANWYFGNGMGSVYETCAKDYIVPLPHAHNDILEIGYTFGMVGLVTWCAFFLGSIRYVLKYAKREDRKLFICSMMVFLVVGVTSGSVLRAEFFPFAMFFAIMLRHTYNHQTANLSRSIILFNEMRQKEKNRLSRQTI